MPIIPGKYLVEASAVKTGTSAQAVVLIVFDGIRGSGVNALCDIYASQRHRKLIADCLRETAQAIEEGKE